MGGVKVRVDWPHPPVGVCGWWPVLASSLIGPPCDGQWLVRVEACKYAAAGLLGVLGECGQAHLL